LKKEANELSTSLCWLVVAPFVGLLADTATHILLCRFLRPRNALLPIGIGFFAGLGAVTVVDEVLLRHASIASTDWLGYTLFNSVGYAALAFNYFAFVNLNVTSLRVRLVKELIAANGAAPVDALLHKYDAEVVIDRRLARLTGWRQLRRVEGQFFGDRSAFLILARMLGASKRCLFGPPAVRGSRPR
jgi:hypothetical protein